MHQRVLLYIVGCGLSEHIGDIVIERTEVISMSTGSIGGLLYFVRCAGEQHVQITPMVLMSRFVAW